VAGLPLVTERLVIRPFVAADLDALHAVYGDPEVTRWMPPYSELDDTRRALEIHIAEAAASRPAFWAVIDRASGELIGDAGLGLVEGGGGELGLGYTLGRAWWGRGYATEAARACLRYAFEELRLPEVLAVVRPENVASIRVLEKIGMQLRGRRVAYGFEHLLYGARRAGA
jgi:[ribosomal protein S5]-alanine N-acetyltransferase